MRALSTHPSTGVPVPRMMCFCDDATIIGTPFYIMEYVTGRIFNSCHLPEIHNHEERFAIYHSMMTTLAALHRVNPASINLSDFGPTSERYAERQVQRWYKQYQASVVDNNDDMNYLYEYVRQHVPDEPSSMMTKKKATLVHGDYRLDNLIFHPTEPRVIAVLDWELSTLGEAIADLAYVCMCYHNSATNAYISGLMGHPLSTLGIPNESQFIHAYTMAVKRHGPVDNYQFYLALSYFRLAAIAQGVYKRSLQGNASSSQAKLFDGVTKQLARTGRNIAESHNITIQSSPTEQDLQVTLDRALYPFPFSSSLWSLRTKLNHFLYHFVYPNEATYDYQHAQLTARYGSPWHVPPIIEELKVKARELGLFNLFMVNSSERPKELCSPFTNLDYALLCEMLGSSPVIAPEVTNCNAPDTGNMEVLANYGTARQREQWLTPLMAGYMRSCYAMSEPAVASSDATNIEFRIEHEGDMLILNGRKHWISGALDPRCRLCILMGRSFSKASQVPLHKQQTMVLVDMKTPGVKIVRAMTVFGSDDAPHGHAELVFENVRVPMENILLGEGRGFEIAQGRLGPGRIHHCMRLIGMAERALDLMKTRSLTRTAFGSSLASKGALSHVLAQSRVEIDACRLLVLQAASMMDSVGNKQARKQIAMIKVATPRMAVQVIDRAIQVYGATGVSQDTVLAMLYVHARTLQIADGPDEVHLTSLANMELKKARL